MSNWKIRPSNIRRDKQIIKLFNQGNSIAELSRKFHLYHSQISLIVNPEMRKKHNQRMLKYRKSWSDDNPKLIEEWNEASNVCNKRRYATCPTFRKKVLEYSNIRNARLRSRSQVS